MIQQLPDNLSDYSWAGSLTKKVVVNNRMACAVTFGLIVVLAVSSAVVVWYFTGDESHLLLAIPITTWLCTLAIPFIYMLTTRTVRILEIGKDGRYFLNTGKWFKNAVHPFKEADARYEHGNRVFWIHKMPDGSAKPLDIYDATERNPRDNPATPAQIAGIKGYTDSVRSYAFKKRYTLQEQIKVGLMVAGIALLLLGMFMMSGRLLDDSVDSPAQPAAASAQESQVRR